MSLAALAQRHQEICTADHVVAAVRTGQWRGFTGLTARCRPATRGVLRQPRRQPPLPDHRPATWSATRRCGEVRLGLRLGRRPQRHDQPPAQQYSEQAADHPDNQPDEDQEDQGGDHAKHPKIHYQNHSPARRGATNTRRRDKCQGMSTHSHALRRIVIESL